jgi:hypothetical protein
MWAADDPLASGAFAAAALAGPLARRLRRG